MQRITNTSNPEGIAITQSLASVVLRSFRIGVAGAMPDSEFSGLEAGCFSNLFTVYSRMLDERPNFFPGLERGNIHQGASQTPNPVMFGRPRCDFDPPSPSQTMSAYCIDYLEISPPPIRFLVFLDLRALRFMESGCYELNLTTNGSRFA